MRLKFSLLSLLNEFHYISGKVNGFLLLSAFLLLIVSPILSPFTAPFRNSLQAE